MPDKPLWFSQLPLILASLAQRDPASPPWITRQDVESLLGVGPRRAQQILLACPHHRLGRNLLVSLDNFRSFLLHAAASSPAQAESLRRQRLASMVQSWRQNLQTNPPILISAPSNIAKTRLDSLPQEVQLTDNLLLITHHNRQDLLEKLLALACALAHDE